MESKIIGRYRITYSTGSQEKNLISHDDYLNIIKPTQEEIYLLEKENNWKPTKQTKLMKEELLKQFSSEYFTDGSPLFKAIATGILELPESQGGKHYCKMELI